MSFSRDWDERYLRRGAMSSWPWSDLIGHCKRLLRGNAAGARVLELGCATGANLPFFLAEGMDYHGVEGSAGMVAGLLQRFPHLEGRVACADFTAEIPFPGPFDLIVDRSSLTHNSTAAIRRCLAMARPLLAPGGKFIGIDWFSTEHADFPRGEAAEDAFTRRGFASGLFQDVGRVHFSDQAHLQDLFREFQIEFLEHKIAETRLPANGHRHATWNLVAGVRDG